MPTPLQVSKHLYREQLERFDNLLKKHGYQKVNTNTYLNLKNEVRVYFEHIEGDDYWFISSGKMKINQKIINIFEFNVWDKNIFFMYNPKILKDIVKIYQREIELLEKKLEKFKKLNKTIDKFKQI